MLQGPIIENLLAAGLEKDCPFVSADAAEGREAHVLTAETVDEVSGAAFMEYTSSINTYLQVSPKLSHFKRCHRALEYLIF